MFLINSPSANILPLVPLRSASMAIRAFDQAWSRLSSPKHLFLSFLFSLAFVIALTSKTSLAEDGVGETQVPQRLLVSDEDLQKNWQSYGGGMPGAGWVVQNGEVHLRKGRGVPQGGNLLSIQEYSDFELIFEFKNVSKGNSGIKYRVAKFGDSWLGFEYQIYDEASFENVPPNGVTGAIYDLYEPIENRPLNPPGQWNLAKVIVQGNRIEHWLNDVLIAKAEIGDSDWDERYSKSKFNETPGFGRVASGKLMITDHGSPVWLRNLSIRELGSREPALRASVEGKETP